VKKDLDILLVYPSTGWAPAAMRIAENDAPPMGLLYVASAARNAGLRVAVVDLNHFPGGDVGLYEFVALSNPKIIGLSVLTTASGAAKRLIGGLNERFPKITLVAGGIHATVLPSDLLSAGCDYAVIGEGEATLPEIARAVLDGTPVTSVAGIAFLERDNPARLIKTMPRAVLHELDRLPPPARDLVPIVDYGQSGALISSRGCPYACAWCSSVLSQMHVYRPREVSAVVAELAEVHGRYGIDHFQFLDDNFTVNPNRVLELADALAGLGVVWSCQGTLRELTSRLDILDRMFTAGCREIYFGIESGNLRLFRKFKGMDLDEALRVVRHAACLRCTSKNGNPDRLRTVCGFIIGHPDDDQMTITDTFNCAIDLRSLGIDAMVSILQPYPGSAVHANPARYGITIENHDFSQYLYPKANISTRNLSRESIQRLYSAGLLQLVKTYGHHHESKVQR
jgi:radical SAM superfamily enzyme YgiQ (UPF0313 family)